MLYVNSKEALKNDLFLVLPLLLTQAYCKVCALVLLPCQYPPQTIFWRSGVAEWSLACGYFENHCSFCGVRGEHYPCEIRAGSHQTAQFLFVIIVLQQ